MTSTRTIRLAPSILDADFGRLADELAVVEQAGIEMFHLDVMDGHFVPNLSFGLPVVASIRRNTALFLDTHLMIQEPVRYAPAFAQAGASSISFHVEVVKDPIEAARQIKALGVKVGVALNPGTPAEAILDVLDEVDIVLVMTVWPGFGGQAFMSECLPKIELLAKRLHGHQWLEVDGGITAQTAPLAISAGANALVIGKAIYGSADRAAAVAEMRSVIQSAAARRRE